MGEFRIADVNVERAHIRDKDDLLLGVIATFEIWIKDRLLYREQMFPVVELRVQLERWLADGMQRGDDFEFQSMDSDESGLVWFRKESSVAWRVGSINQEYPEIQTLTNDDVDNLVVRFAHDVDSWVQDNLDIQPSFYL